MAENLRKDELYIFNTPKSVLNSLELMYFNDDDIEVTEEFTKQQEQHQEQEQRERERFQGASTPDGASFKKIVATNSTFCSACNVDIESRDHYKTDFHRFNLKRDVSGLPKITELEFQELFSKDNDSEESISGSEDEEDSEIDELTTVFESSMQKFNEANDTNTADNSDNRASYLNTKSPFIYMKSSLLPENKILGAYKHLFNETRSPIQQLSDDFKESQSSAIFMIGGGHFAGAIVSHTRLKNITFNKKIELSLQEQMVNILHHKTFHRYTTRRKQGGSQSAMDNAKGKANSAGSTLRRYNEAALKQDVQKLLQDWAPHLENCRYIFIRANGIANRKILINDESPLKNKDTRIMNLPFTTKRPTTSELKRSWAKLSYFQILTKPESTKKPVDSKNKSAPTQQPQKEAKKVEIEEETPEIVHSKELIQLLKKAKAPLLIAYLKKNKLDVNFELEPKSQYATNTSTLLHYASNNGLKNMTYILLNTLKADPTIKNSLGRVAADLTNKTEIKQAFQMARHNLGESYANWDEDAHVGLPLTREMIDQQESEKEDAKSKALKEKLDEARQEQRLQQEEKRKNDKVLGGTALQPSNLQQTINSLTPEQKMRYMREQRARAAEARMKLNK